MRLFLHRRHVPERVLEAAGDNPAADPNGNITVRPGNRLPGIPAHQLKAGATYKVTDKWTVGANLVAASSAYLVGDEANLTAPLPPYATLDLTTSYRPLPNVEVFAWARNVTNSPVLQLRHVLADVVGRDRAGAGATATPSYSLAAPVSVFGGVRITF